MKMTIKLIKFDLPINGIKVTTLEALRDNLTDEIVPLARSGQLERWFKSRQMQEQAQAVAAAVAQHAEDKALFLALCAVLEVHPDNVSNIFFEESAKVKKITSNQNSISSRVDLQPYEVKVIYGDRLDFDETEKNIDIKALINIFSREATAIGMSVSNINTFCAEQFYFSGTDLNKRTSFAIDKTESRLWITHKGRAYLPLLHIFDYDEICEFQVGTSYKHLNFTSKLIVTTHGQAIDPIKIEELIEHQGKILILGIDTFSPHLIKYNSLHPQKLKEAYEHIINYYKFLKINFGLNGNELFKIIRFMPLELDDLASFRL